jgi:hypothetical protein
MPDPGVQCVGERGAPGGTTKLIVITVLRYGCQRYASEFDRVTSIASQLVASVETVNLPEDFLRQASIQLVS